MKPCYLCGKRTDDCLFDPPVCRECQRAHDLTKERVVAELAVGTPEGWKSTQTWTSGRIPAPGPMSWTVEVGKWDESFTRASAAPARRVTFPVGEDGRPTGPGVAHAAGEVHCPPCGKNVPRAEYFACLQRPVASMFGKARLVRRWDRVWSLQAPPGQYIVQASHDGESWADVEMPEGPVTPGENVYVDESYGKYVRVRRLEDEPAKSVVVTTDGHASKPSPDVVGRDVWCVWCSGQVAGGRAGFMLHMAKFHADSVIGERDGLTELAEKGP